MNNTFWGFAWARLAPLIAGRKAIPWLFARFRNFERPEHAPWSPAKTHTCTVYRRVPCVPRGRERQKRPAAARENLCIPGKKLNFMPGT